MRIIAIGILAVTLGAASARAQSLVDVTAAAGINNQLNANGTTNTIKMKDTITQKLQASSTSSTGKGGWEEADAGHAGSHTTTGGGTSKAWASGKSGGGSSAWARAGDKTPTHHP